MESLADLLAYRSQDDVHGFTVVDGAHHRMSFAATWRRATRTALGLLDAVPGVAGRPVLVTTSDPLDLVVGFFGALLAGARPVPVPDPGLGHPRNRLRVLMLVDACAPAAVVAPTHRVDAVTRTLAHDGRTVSVLATAVGAPLGADLPPADLRQADLPPVTGVEEYWQYTSGTSGTPKRIAVRASQALVHLSQAALTYEEDPTSVSVSWVPLHHDMGLVTSILRPLHAGYDSVMLPAARFVAEPTTWLAALTEFGATHTSSPDFGYALTARKVGSTAGLDLSALRVARVAGDLVRASTLDRFTTAFAPVGFRREAFAPSFGMAEAVLTVTTCAVDEPPRTLRVDRAALAEDVVREADADADAVSVVSCGRPLPGTTVTITTPGPGAAAPGTVGEVHIAGPQVVLEPVPAVVGDVVGRLTGDLGFVRDGELYLLGRSLERFQVNGENHYLAEVESIAQEAASDLRPGRVRAVPVAGDDDGLGAGVVLLAELRDDPAARTPEAMTATWRAVVGAVARRAGLAVEVVHLVEQGALPVTSSGKLRRTAVDAGPPGGTIRTYRRESEKS